MNESIEGSEEEAEQNVRGSAHEQERQEKPAAKKDYSRWQGKAAQINSHINAQNNRRGEQNRNPQNYFHGEQQAFIVPLQANKLQFDV